MNAYRNRILDHIRRMLGSVGTLDTALDFGSGDGFFASQWETNGLVREVTAVDVVARKSSIVAPLIYDGKRLPFPDRSFDLAYSVDVLHHCPDPLQALADLSRCSRRYLMIKDHTYRGPVGRFALAVLDEVGNRRFGIPSPYLYQHGWQWVEQVESSGWRRIELIHPMRCHSGLMGAATNALQFIGLWERKIG
jgi:SAM-dependent methyltransferase